MISAQDRQHGGSGSNPVATESEAEMKARLAAEIALLEAQLQRKQSKRKLKAASSGSKSHASNVTPLHDKQPLQNSCTGSTTCDSSKTYDNDNPAVAAKGSCMNNFQARSEEPVSQNWTKQHEKNAEVPAQAEKKLSSEEAERIRLQEEIQFMEARIREKKDGRPTPKRTISRRASEREKLADEILKMEAEIQASRQARPPKVPKRKSSMQITERPAAPGGRSSFLMSIKEAAIARDASLREEEDPVVLTEATTVPLPAPTPPPLSKKEHPPQQPLRQPSAKQERPKPPAPATAGGRSSFLASIKQAAVARDASLREDDDPIVIQPAVVAQSPRRPQSRPKAPMVADSSGSRANFLESVKQAAFARDASLRDEEDPVVIQRVSSSPTKVKETVASANQLPPRSPQKHRKSPMATDSIGRAGFLESVKQAAIARDASLREEEDPVVIQAADALVNAPSQGRTYSVPPSPHRSPKAPTATDSSSRVGFLESIKQAAVARDTSLREEEDPLVPQASPQRPKPQEERVKDGDSLTIAETAPPLPTVNGNRVNLLAAIQQTAVGREKRLEATGGELIMTEVEEVEPSTEAVRFNLLASVKNAASAREKRLEQSNGKLIMKEHEPEVKAQRQSTPQLSFSLAEMVTKKAMEREKRLEGGGEKRMTKIKEKEEYKKDFSDICIEAAALGRLTRLKEYEVEAVATEKTPEQEWKSNGLLAIQWRCNYMSIIHEAAQVGSETKLPETIVSNCPEEEQDWDADEEEKKLSPRMKQLLELNNRVGEGQHKVDKLVLGRKEQQVDGLSLLVRPMYAYSNIDDVKLPKPDVPSIHPHEQKKRYKAKQEEAERFHRPMIDIGNEVATIAWERRTRLDRPGAMPKIKEECTCPYCGSASPYQTFAYREIHRKHKEAIHNQKAMQRLEEEIKELERITKEKERIAREEREREEERQQLELEEQQQEQKRRAVEEWDQPERVVEQDQAPLPRKPIAEQGIPAQTTTECAPSPPSTAADQNCACVIL